MNHKLPNQIPIFPLSGVIYFPNTNLPLNIFEKRYLDLVNDTMKTNKLMGMVQSKREGGEVYNVGCLGKIDEFNKNEDGRLIINLSGISRFKIIREVNNSKLYREFEVEYKEFERDCDKNLKFDIKDMEFNLLLDKSRNFFEKNGLLINWKEFEKIEKEQQINTLAMISPISDGEKQKLLETTTPNEKTKVLTDIIEFYLHDNNFNKITLQ